MKENSWKNNLNFVKHVDFIKIYFCEKSQKALLSYSASYWDGLLVEVSVYRVFGYTRFENVYCVHLNMNTRYSVKSILCVCWWEPSTRAEYLEIVMES